MREYWHVAVLFYQDHIYPVWRDVKKRITTWKGMVGAVALVLMMGSGIAGVSIYRDIVDPSRSFASEFNIIVHPYAYQCEGARDSCLYGIDGVQKAIERARDGDVILLKSGKYDGNLVIGGAQQDEKNVVLVGENTMETVINGAGFLHDTVHINGQSSVVLKSLTIRNGGYNGVHATDIATVAIEDCIIELHNFNGVYLSKQARLSYIQGTTIRSNGGIPSTGAGIALVDFSKGIIKDNIIMGNKLQGIYIESKNDNLVSTISKNHIINNGQSGIALFQFAQAEIINNVIENNEIDGVTLQDQSRSETISGNVIASNANYGVLVLDYAEAKVQEDNPIELNGQGALECQGVSRSQCVGFDQTVFPTRSPDMLPLPIRDQQGAQAIFESNRIRGNDSSENNFIQGITPQQEDKADDDGRQPIESAEDNEDTLGLSDESSTESATLQDDVQDNQVVNPDGQDTPVTDDPGE